MNKMPEKFSFIAGIIKMNSSSTGLGA